MPMALRVLIPDGDSPFAHRVAQCLGRGDRTIEVHAAFVDARALCRYSRFVRRSWPLDRNDPAGTLVSLLEARRYDLLLPVSGPGIELVSGNCGHLRGLVEVPALPDVEQLALVNDKWAFHQAMVRAGIAVPATVLLDRADRVHELPAGALLAKPRSGSGGHGIVRFDHADAFLAQADGFLGPDHPYILQQYLPGRDIDRSILCREGRVLASTVQEALAHPGRFKPGSVLRFRRDAGAEAIVDQVAQALGWNGIAHVDLRRDGTDGSTRLIELNPRYWSTLMASLAAGVNFPLLQLRNTLARATGGPVTPRGEHLFLGIREQLVHRMRRVNAQVHSSLAHILADPWVRLMEKVRPSSALGIPRA